MTKFPTAFFIIIFSLFSVNIFAADININTAVTSQQEFTENGQAINVNNGGAIDVSEANVGVYVSESFDNNSINIDTGNSATGISSNREAILLLRSENFELNLISGKITSDTSNFVIPGDSTVYLKEAHSTSTVTLVSGTLIENNSTHPSATSTKALKVVFEDSNDYNFTINNSGTILGRNDSDSNALELFNDSTATSRLFTVNNNGGVISAGAVATNTAILISGDTRTVINNSNSGSIIGGIGVNITTKEIDITNSSNATIEGDINLSTHAGSSLTITGGSVTGELTFGDTAQTLDISGSGYFLGTISGTGVISIGSNSSLILDSSTLSSNVNGHGGEGAFGSLIISDDQTVTLDSDVAIGATKSLLTTWLRDNATLDLATNNNSLSSQAVYLNDGAILNVGTATVNGNIQGNTSEGIGTVNFTDNNTLGGDIGIGDFKVSLVNISANKTLTAGNNNIIATTISIAGGGSLDSQGGDIIGAISLGDASSLTLGIGSTSAGSINGSSSGQGNLSIEGGIVIINSTIGDSNSLSTITVSSDAQARFTEDFAANDIDFAGQVDFEKTGGNTVTGNLAASGSDAILRIYNKENNIVGNFTMNSGNTILLGISDENTAGSILATGIATIAENLVLRVSVESGDTRAGSSYVIISGADGSSINQVAENNIKINDSDTNIFGNLRFTTSVSENQLLLLVSSLNTDPLGQNGNQRSLYSYITNLDSASGNLLTIKNLLDAEDDNAAASQILNSLSPQTDSSSNRLSFVNVSDSANLTSQRLNSLHSGISSGDESSKKSSWAQTFGSKINQGNNSASQGYKASSYGFAVGYDHEIADDMIAGLSFSYANSSINSIVKLQI